MLLKRSPPVDARYWTAILVLGACGINLGDVFPDVLHLGFFPSLAIEVGAFALIVLVDRFSPRGFAASYWLCMLWVRSAAVNIADSSIHDLNLTYAPTALGCVVILGALIALQFRQRPETATAPTRTDALFWLTVLTAGTLGTLIGDWGAHSQASVVVSVLTSLAAASLALAVALILRAKVLTASLVMYWLAIVSAGWWGANAGDILAHVTTLIISLSATAFLLLAVIAIRTPWVRKAERSN